MSKTFPQLYLACDGITNEQNIGGNTKEEVGGLFHDIVEKTEELSKSETARQEAFELAEQERTEAFNEQKQEQKSEFEQTMSQYSELPSKVSELESEVFGKDGYADLTKTVTFTDNKFQDGRVQYNYAVINNNDYKISDFIPVVGGTTIKIVIGYRFASNNFAGWATYDANKQPLLTGDHYTYGTTDIFGSNVLRTLDIPEGVSFIRVSYSKTDSTPFQYLAPAKLDGLRERIDKLAKSVDETTKELAEELKTQHDATEDLKDEIDSVLGKRKTIVVNEYLRESYNSSFDILRFDLGIDIADTANVNSSFTSFTRLVCLDKFGQICHARFSLPDKKNFSISRCTRTVGLLIPPTQSVGDIELVISDIKEGNAFDEPQFATNAMVDETGTIFANDEFYVVGRFRVDGAKTYCIQSARGGISQSTVLKYIFVNEQGSIIGNGSVNPPQKYISGMIGLSFTTPENAAYIYTLISYTPEYDATKDVVIREYSEINNDKKEEKPLTVWVLGDSISISAYNQGVTSLNKFAKFSSHGGIGGWCSEFLDKVSVRPINWINYAHGGWTLSDNTDNLDGDSFIHCLNLALADAAAGDIPSPDIVLVAGCTNDIGMDREVKDADVTASGLGFDKYADYTFFIPNDATYNAKPLIPLADVNKGKIIGALRYIVEKVGDVYKDCKFVFVTPPQNSRKDYTDGLNCVRDMIWAGKRMSIPIIDVWGEAQMPLLWDYNANWSGGSASGELNHRYLDDGIHTFDSGAGSNSVGYKRQGEYIARRFSEIFKDDMFVMYSEV